MLKKMCSLLTVCTVVVGCFGAMVPLNVQAAANIQIKRLEITNNNFLNASRSPGATVAARLDCKTQLNST